MHLLLEIKLIENRSISIENILNIVDGNIYFQELKHYLEYIIIHLLLSLLDIQLRNILKIK